MRVHSPVLLSQQIRVPCGTPYRSIRHPASASRVDRYVASTVCTSSGRSQPRPAGSRPPQVKQSAAAARLRQASRPWPQGPHTLRRLTLGTDDDQKATTSTCEEQDRLPTDTSVTQHSRPYASTSYDGADGCDQVATFSEHQLTTVRSRRRWKDRLPKKLLKLVDKLTPSPRLRGLLMLNVLVLMMASNWIVLKESEHSIDPFTFATLRFTLAALIFAPFGRHAFKDRTTMIGGFEIGVWSAIGYITQSIGLMTTDASRASFLSTFTVIVVPILAGMTGKGVKPLTWASAAAALVGVALLEEGGAPMGMGDVWNLVSALAFGIQIFRTEHYVRYLKDQAVLPIMSIAMLTISIISAVASVATHPQQTANMLEHLGNLRGWVSLDQVPWFPIVYTGVFSTDLALWLEMVALENVPSTDAAIIYTMEPVLGAMMAYAVLGDRWGPSGWAGAGIIVASCLTTQILGEPDEDEH